MVILLVIRDRYNRPVLNLRIAVNGSCNLSCFFCHNEGEYSVLKCSKKELRRELTPKEIFLITKVAAEFGVREVKITGGEPLLRRDIGEIISAISSVKGIEDISMVTNGLLLEKKAYQIASAGLKRINVSLHSLKPDTYSAITGYKSKDGPQRIIRGIKVAKASGLNPVKINFVVLKGLNDDEIYDMIEFSANMGVPVQFIEYHEPRGFSSMIFKTYYYSLRKLEKELESIAVRVYQRRMHARKRYYLPNGAEIEVVRPMFNPDFCANCTRLRVTNEGEFKPCLMRDDNHVNFLDAFQSKDPIKKIREYFIEAVNRREPYYKYPVEVEVGV